MIEQLQIALTAAEWRMDAATTDEQRLAYDHLCVALRARIDGERMIDGYVEGAYEAGDYLADACRVVANQVREDGHVDAAGWIETLPSLNMTFGRKAT